MFQARNSVEIEFGVNVLSYVEGWHLVSVEPTVVWTEIPNAGWRHVFIVTMGKP